ncbi:radical SAM protein [Paenibacillus pseudetheri]|uniref:GTP 3',8-cyclase n=1 Tax=Paenibacillus pseudetheri TaxID=2897682 RepID=A0ABN8FM54_9BACL|nr:radical SAM protein [Paenibacillus pseudetheri]CAH1059049.1 GTP 3',8-cyclase [Paenibacillus pseudetheri]
MNILVNSYCNLSCGYCFAKSMLKDDSIPQNMSVEDFEYCLNFLKDSKLSQLRILGGEPTVSSKFHEYCDIAMTRDHIKRVLLFSNGIIPEHSMESIIKMRSKKAIDILINANPPEFLLSKYSKLEQSIQVLLENKIEVVLGVNLSGENFDYSYILDLLKKYKLKTVRWAIVAPTKTDLDMFEPLQYYKKQIPNALRFLKECYELDVKLVSDCNVIPLCVYDDAQLREISIYNPFFLNWKRCVPVIDVMPNLSVIRCFGTSAIMNTYLKNFHNRNELIKYFTENIDNKLNDVLFSDECKDCILHKKNQCSGGCLQFQLHKKQSSLLSI